MSHLIISTIISDVPLESNLIIELYIPSQHKKKEEIIIGSILIDNLSSIPHDRPLDKWYPIQLRIPSKEPDIPQLHLRLLFSAVMVLLLLLPFFYFYPPPLPYPPYLEGK